ncbi:MAG TPA: HAD-IC family P-type ATPase [Cellulomonas sp.]
MSETRGPAAEPTTPATGLTEPEVAQRVADGRSNDVPARATRSVGEIVRANVLTRINAILAVLLLAVLSTGSVINGAFGLLIIANSAIGVIQEVRAKRTLDALAIVGQTRPTVRRLADDGPVSRALAPDQVVLDDVIELAPGDQVVVDGEVLEDRALEVDESLLTGEADPVVKRPGDPVLSGSFVVAGSGAYRATRVGRAAYAARLTEEASRFTLVRSELRSGIDQILRLVTALMVPAAVLIAVTQLATAGSGWRAAVLGTVGALVPMVPEGLVLLTSIAFAVGVVRLGRQQCLVNELPAIEGLARVDVVCADKTGTLTERGMRVAQIVPLSGLDVGPALARLAADDPYPNASMVAVQEVVAAAPDWQPTAVAPFSSALRWSGASYREHGSWLLGAPDVLVPPGSPAALAADEHGARGLRVLLLGSSDVAVDTPGAPGAVTPHALVVLEQRVRTDAPGTLAYFAEQNVAVKVISGDNATSVGAITGAIGLAGAAVDARTLPEDDLEALADALDAGTAFGRVRPDQKRSLVRALQLRGHTVAMTGDGVNDVLALKDADIGVAMGSGSSAARSVAQIVLLDDRFATLPHVVGEGRRIIGNIERVSTLFLTKTVYSVLLAILVGLVGLSAQLFGTAALPFPFQPIHVTVAGWFTIGIPAFVLSLAPNNERARPGFVRRVLGQALPSGLVVGLTTFASYLLAYPSAGADEAARTRASTAALVTLLVGALWVLCVVARPLQWWRVALVAVSALAYLLIVTVPFAQELFLLDTSDGGSMLVALAIGLGAAALVEGLWWWQGARTGGLAGARQRLWRRPVPQD